MLGPQQTPLQQILLVPHVKLFGWGWSGGHSGEAPVQNSGASQGPVAGRQTVLAGRNWLGGQTGEFPVQFSGTSQGPAAGRQTKVDGLNWSGGH
jgi:hypothetical protein